MTDRGFYFRWFIGGIVVLLLVAGVCYLWYHYDTAPYRREAAKAEEFARQWEKNQKAEPKSTTAEQATDGTPAEIETQSAEKPTTDRTTPASTKNNAPGRTQDGAVDTPSPENTKPVRMSPHGFGPYPEIPEGSPFDEFHFHESQTRTMELLGRVEIKAWINGERFLGSSSDSRYGKMYLHYPNTLYVEYGEPVEDIDGNVRIPITDSLGAGDVRLTPEQMKNGEIPDGVRVLSLRDDGIDPYEYLDLH